jgi:hypothetical protein
LLIVIISVFSINAFATVQEPDLVWYKGKFLIISNNNGLEVAGSCYPLSSCTLKIDWSDNTSSRNTANAKGYIATWKISNDSLFLVKIQNGDFKEVPLQKLFPGQNCVNGLFASWYNGFFKVITEDSFLTFDKEVRAKGLILLASFKHGVINEKVEPQSKK